MIFTKNTVRQAIREKRDWKKKMIWLNGVDQDSTRVGERNLRDRL